MPSSVGWYSGFSVFTVGEQTSERKCSLPSVLHVVRWYTPHLLFTTSQFVRGAFLIDLVTISKALFFGAQFLPAPLANVHDPGERSGGPNTTESLETLLADGAAVPSHTVDPLGTARRHALLLSRERGLTGEQ
jgi:hypothetical protein